MPDERGLFVEWLWINATPEVTLFRVLDGRGQAEAREVIGRGFLGTVSRWNWNERGNWVEGRWVWTERGSGPYGPVTHILGTTAKVAYLFWRRYEYTLDQEWLRNRAYPMLKGSAEFYRHYPNLKKGADGKYHIHHVNSNESVWGAQDTDEDLSALRGLLPAAIRASEILNEDAERGRIGFVELKSQAGGECRLRNPWGESEVTLYRDGKQSENMQGSLLRFHTRKGERIVVVVNGDTLQSHRRALP